MVANKSKIKAWEKGLIPWGIKKWETRNSRPKLWRWELIREQEPESGLDQGGIRGHLTMECQRDEWKRERRLGAARNHLVDSSCPLVLPKKIKSYQCPNSAPPPLWTIDLECGWSRYLCVCVCVFFFTKYPRWFWYMVNVDNICSWAKWSWRASAQPWPWVLHLEKPDSYKFPWKNPEDPPIKGLGIIKWVVLT